MCMEPPSQIAPGTLVEPWYALVDDNRSETAEAPGSSKSLRAIFRRSSAYLHGYLRPDPRPTLSVSCLQPPEIALKRSDFMARQHAM